ncbi:MAG: OmpA family protein [Polyangiaceae bacterium]|nr:OmpA family protein [Polyangiaceae bacterium]MCE7892557.1 hypothetical protein [Sorangiineae bacterium PRO1]MCL4752440.1 OmpA family protein [Myxococcales bacterium]
MSRALRPCRSCSRHLRDGHPTCPFCAASEPLRDVPELRAPSVRLSRAAQLAFTVTLGAAACSPAPRPGTAQQGQKAPSDAGPERLADASESVVADASLDGPQIDAAALVPIYGESTPMILTVIPFAPESAALSTDSETTLDAVAEVLRAHPFVVEIEGHADSSERLGGLGRARAEAVRRRLVALRVRPGALRVKSYSAKRPLAPKRPDLNARVSFRIVEVDGAPP